MTSDGLDDAPDRDQVLVGRFVKELIGDVAQLRIRRPGGGRGGGIILIFCSGVVGGGRKDKNLSSMSFNSIPVYEITKGDGLFLFYAAALWEEGVKTRI